MGINHSESLARVPHIYVSGKNTSWQLAVTMFREIVWLENQNPWI